MIRLETERLILRDFTMDDLPDYYRLKTDDQTMYYTSEAVKRVLAFAFEER